MVSMLAALSTALLVVQLAARLGGRASTRATRRRASSTWVRESGAPFGVGAYWAIRLACALAAFLICFAVTGSRAVGVAAAGGASTIPRVLIQRRWERRRLALGQAWPDALRDLSASVAAGMSLPQAVEALADTGPEPVRVLCARVPALLPAIGLQATLERLRAEAADPMTDRVVEVLQLAYERGGRMLPAILGDLAESAARDVHLSERITTAQLELRINARAVFALPWLVLGVLTARPGPFRDFYASTRGLPVIALGAALSCAGMAIVERLGRVPVEPRVFTGRRA